MIDLEQIIALPQSTRVNSTLSRESDELLSGLNFNW